MTFNIWKGGTQVDNGLYKVANHIKIVNPDIVALQEVLNKEIFDTLAEDLGKEYTGVTAKTNYSDVAIFTKHKLNVLSLSTTPSSKAIGVEVTLSSGEVINFWSLHLDHHSYGPYAANNKQVTNLSQIEAGESPKSNDGRVDNIVELLNSPIFNRAVENDKVPLIVCGDFNSPSHLDWIESTKEIHGGWVIRWPATYLLQKSTGLIDTFREIYPDPKETPGITWSTVYTASGSQWDYSIPEPFDRIDYIFRKGDQLKTIDSFVYSGKEKMENIPNHFYNDYPSDHYAVVTDFELTVTREENIATTCGANVEDGLYKIAKHIRIMDPDIVALQEVEGGSTFENLTKKLGGSYVGVTTKDEYPNVGIITKHRLNMSSVSAVASSTSIGVQVQLWTGQLINFWCLHLDYRSYGPYAANNKQVTNISQIEAGEAPKSHNGRVDNILELLKNPTFKAAVENDKVPLIVCGDFNSPSHLDWIESTKEIHGGWVIRWPATYLLQKSTDLIDTFREIYPDPKETPGITWSTVHRASGSEWDYLIPEPLDRLDFIFRKGNQLKTTDSFVYSGTERLGQIPNHSQNDYPSDHYAVVTDFELILGSKENQL